MRTLCGLGLALLLTSAGLAQARSPCFLTVVDAAGAPIAGAAVTCAFTPDLVSLGDTDIVTATTDERGRARCDVVVGRLYEAWGVGPPGPDGTRPVTAAHDLVSSGRVLELRAIARAAPRHVRIDGLTEWRETGGVAIRWFAVAGQDAAAELPLPADDEVLLPPGPPSPGCLAVVDAAGAFLVAAAVEEGADGEVRLPRPMAFVLTVRDAKGAPVAGAAVEYPVSPGRSTLRLLESTARRRWLARDLGATDARGELRGLCPEPWRFDAGGNRTARPLLLRVRAGARIAGVLVGGPGPVEVTLAEPVSTELTIRGLDASMHVGACSVFELKLAKGRATAFSDQPTMTRLGPSRWSVPSGPRGFWLRIACDERVPTVVVPERVVAPDGRETVDLDALRRFEVEVVDAAGGLAPAAIAVGLPSGGPTNLSWSGVVATDLAGRARVRLPPGPYRVYATNGSEHALALATAETGGELRLTLEPIPTMRVEVRDTDGAPVAGARAFFAEGRFVAASGIGLEQQWRQVAMGLCERYAATARSDVHGELRFPACLGPGFSTRLEIHVGARKSERFALEPDASVRVVVRDE
ncbi:MAG: hypothetical protein KDE27_26450 [Planctomycetes bacterium]|nr:hypothetical protein [Planctomycetota bacterium]